MSKVHTLSDELLDIIQEELRQQNYWIAYNNRSYSLEVQDVWCFKNKHEASEFTSNNYGDYDSFSVIYANSIHEVKAKIGNGKALHRESYSDHDINGLHNHEGNPFTDAIIDHFERQQLLNTQNINIMNQKNFEYLKDQVKFTGFGEGLEDQIKEKMQKLSDSFTLSHQTKFGNDTVDATLNFRKSDKNEMYFFNSYQLNLQKENSAESMNQTFFINKSNNITLKEAYNLMSGRAVNKDLTNKEGQLYNAWVQMNFTQTDNNGNYKLKQYHHNYGFDLNKELAKHPIKDLGNEQDKLRLIESLEKGNKQSVTFLREGNEQKHFIEANPQFKTINIYDSNMQRQVVRQAKEEKQSQGEGKTSKQSAKKDQSEMDDLGNDTPKAVKKRAKKQSLA